MTRRRLTNEELCLISQVELASIIEACKDECWTKVMEEELNRIEKNETWTLVPQPKKQMLLELNGFLGKN